MGLSLALQGAGIFSKYRAGQGADSARLDAINNEIARQDAYRRQATGIFRPVMDSFTAPAQMTQRAGIAADRTAALTGNQGAPLPVLPGAGSAPEPVKKDGARYISRAVTEGKDFAKRLARLGAYGESDFTDRIALAGSRRGLANIADFAGASAEVLPLEVGAAQQQGISPFGDLLMGAGQVAGMGSALGYGPGWGDIFGRAGYGATGAGKTIVGASGMMGGGV